MTVTINGTPIELDEQCALSVLLDRAAVKVRTGIAVAVNDAVVSRSRWDTYLLAAGDSVVIITATQGG